MSQYSTGLSSVTNNSPTVTGTNTLWLANVTAGDSFTVAGDGVMYDVASVDSDTQVTLSAPYAGTTASGVVYAIGTGFTVPDSFPEMSQGDIETATIFTRAMRGIQGKFSSILAGGANANFTTMPQVGGDPVVESGSNADGEWTRWADGTQICTHVITDTANDFGDGTLINMYRSAEFTWTFSVSFISAPVVSSSVSTSAATNGADAFVVASVGRDISSSNASSIQMFRGTNIGNVEVCNVQATGRWK